MTPEEFKSKARNYRNSTPELLSMLYDLDLMPEQVEEGTLDYKRMLYLCVWHSTVRGDGNFGPSRTAVTKVNTGLIDASTSSQP